MISYKDFSKLRLENFIPNKKDIQICNGFEFMGEIWTGQSLGFTEWLQFENDRTNTMSITIDFNGLSERSINIILSMLEIEIQKGMNQDQILKILGQPNNIITFVEDRLTFDYVIGGREKYYLSLTVHNVQGLIYLVLINHPDIINTVLRHKDNHLYELL